MDGSGKKIEEKNQINEFLRTRNLTLELTTNLYPEDMVIQTEEFVSPIKWHLGHTTWFFENCLLVPYLKKYRRFRESYNFIFNSYYNSFGDFNSKDRRGFLNRPILEEVVQYRKYVEENICDLFKKTEGTSKKFILELGINHEQQHQELILMDIKNIFFNNPLKPSFKELKVLDKKNKKEKNEFTLNRNISFKSGWLDKTFCYDNELPSNEMHLEPFKITNFITNSDWKDFIKNGGYSSYEFWLSDGWDFIKENNIKRPLYWIDEDYHFTLRGVKKIDNSLPVSHISFYEAHAFANYKGLRLPNEFEVEYFLKNSSVKGNFLENQNYKELDYSQEKYKDSLYGNLWLWTSSNYLPFKNYKPFKQELMEYNSKFMCNQFVLKGGSYGTSSNHIRSSYRNFYYPKDRWQFCGLRLVEDLN
jgi:ergothioneine biosynthesis protein EgtB